jgi:hypothetical protein
MHLVLTVPVSATEAVKAMYEAAALRAIQVRSCTAAAVLHCIRADDLQDAEST